MSTLILTHEQADFDAVASLWAAHRLYPHALPVLPRRVNRNVRAFLNLYGDHFGFVELADLPRRRVDRVILVDTQSAASVRGMSPHTESVVIDHHASPSAAEPPVGANTTLLTERIAEAVIPLSPIEAALLLLGIYEDTGSLTYLTTSPRDARAAAYLMEQGAPLDSVREFLHHPLTDGQRALFEQLLAAATTHRVNSQPITLAAIDGGDIDEELSTLAHKLRDTLDPVALFVLVNLPGREPRVQLIARSTTANVDVGAVAAHFGGGGHGRAAAAVVRDKTLDEVRAALLACLPAHVRPPDTVAQIMSHGVQTLSPQATIADAAERFQKYSYEGYPVVEGGRVVGLLTRRAVDRALQHQLEAQPVSAVMDAGEVTVAPTDSLEALQAVMTARGWGQVPVVEDGDVIGVVTRTDLIKRLAASARAASPRRLLADRLARALSPAHLRLLHTISDSAADLGVSIFIVGGFVRDLLLGIDSQDFDVVVEGDAIALARSLAAAHGGRVTAHGQFGTAKWIFPPGPDSPLPHLDFVSARTEFYPHPSALPEVERGSIKLDLHRRDFTINTLALRLDRDAFGELLDFWGGESDLRHGLIRVLHSLSFVDDPTRVLRAVRFEQRFRFRVEGRTAELIAHALPLLRRVSGDRIRHELDVILREPEPERYLARLAALGILAQVQAELTADSDLPRQFAAIRTLVGSEGRAGPMWAVWLSPLPPAALEAVLARLRFRARTADLIRQVADLRRVLADFAQDLRQLRMSEIHARLASFDDEALRIALVLCEDASCRARITDYMHRLETLKPATTGRELRALGLPPGPRYGQILARLQNAYLDGEIADARQEEALLEKLIGESKQPSP